MDEPAQSWRGWVLPALGAAGAAVLCVLAIRGWSYYRLDWAQRFDAPSHRVLRSSGRVGHLYGWIGVALIATNLSYLVRRRFAHVEWLGSMRGWMQWHVLSGTLGPGFVVLHSALTLRTQVAMVSSLALAIVVGTGLIGRYLHVLLPRGKDGRPRSLDDLAEDVDQHFLELRRLGAPGRAAADLIEARISQLIAPALEAKAHRVAGVAALARTLRAIWRLRALPALARDAARAAGASHADEVAIGRRARQLGLLELRAESGAVLQAAAESWRGLHRVTVVIMMLTASLHISIAVYLGYVW